MIMSNCCKVIVTFIGPRPVRTPQTVGRCRFGNHYQDRGNAAGVLQMLEDVYRLECEIDPGIPMDTVLVCNGGYPPEASGFIQRIDGSKTARGRLRVIERENTGLSFGGYAHVFKKYRDKYKFWIFTEDDILFHVCDYAATAQQVLLQGNHFITPFRIADRHRRPHCYGGVGFTRRAVLDRVAEQFGGTLPYHDRVPDQSPDGRFKHHKFVRYGEIEITNTIVRLGMQLKELRGIAEFYYEWAQ